MLHDFAIHQLDTDNDIWMQDGAPIVELYMTSWMTLSRYRLAREEPLNGLHNCQTCLLVITQCGVS